MKDRERNVVGKAIHIIQPGGENLERANGPITLRTWRRRMVVDKRGLSVYVCPYLNYQTGPALLSISRPTHGLPWSMQSTQRQIKHSILTLSLTSDRWGHSVTPNNSLKSSLNIFTFYILVKYHMLDSLWVLFRSENGTLLYV